jgi:hypothetical protein
LPKQILPLRWTDGRNVRIDTRWAAGDAERFRRYSAELVALAPDVILASGGTGVGQLLQASRTVPIVFTQTQDPVGAGYVDSLARPGGNATSFTTMEYGSSGKYLELLKEIAPRMVRAAILRDATTPQGIGQFGAIRAGAIARGGGARDRCARRARDRAGRHDIRALREWRPDRDGKCHDCASSRSNHHAGSSAQIALPSIGNASSLSTAA